MKTACTLKVFGLYAILTGLTFIVYPAITLTLQLPAISDGWLRLVGLLAIVVGVYYIVNAAFAPF